MILSARRSLLKNDVLDLPPWIRAPVYVNQGQTVYVTLDPEALLSDRPTLSNDQAPNREFVELVISPFAPEIWGDVWRLEMETHDRPGNLNRILAILSRLKLDVLMGEGSTNSNGRHHEMMFVVSARHYSSQNDADTKKRSTAQIASLSDLYDELAIRLIDTVTLRPDGKPHMNIRRIQTYFSLYERFSAHKIKTPIALKVGPRGTIKLPKALSQDIHKRLDLPPTAQLTFSPAVDTKDRIVRLMCFGRGPRSPCYAQILVPRDSDMVSQIFQKIANLQSESDVKINVIRYQLRPGLGAYAGEAGAATDTSFMRLELTFVPMDPWESKKELFQRLAARLQEIPDFRFGCRVSRVMGDDSDEKHAGNDSRRTQKGGRRTTKTASPRKPARARKRR